MPNYSPIAIFAYVRTTNLNALLNSLEQCEEFSSSPVFIFSDGPKSDAAVEDVRAVRSLIRARLRSNITLIEQPQNIGLANSIIQGATKLCNDYERVIILEDDLIVSPKLLTYFNSAITKYAAHETVMQVSGHMFDVRNLIGRSDAIFLPFTTSWGWATWKRAWDKFDPHATGWNRICTDRKFRKRFDLNGAYPWAQTLEKQMAGEIDSWAIRWYWTVFNATGLVLHPPQSLISNVGIDNKATHGNIRRIILNLFRASREISDQEPTLPDDPMILKSVRRAIRLRRI